MKYNTLSPFYKQMKIDKQINNQNDRLLLFFSGWSASPLLFKDLKADEGTDLWIAYDYRTLSFDESLSGYQHVDIIAWSMGVWVADYLLHRDLLAFHPTFTATALNGTPCPINDTYGIPETIFRGTLENLTDENLRRFNRRICGNRQQLAAYKQAAPLRPLDEVRDELQHLASASSALPAPNRHWTHTVICRNDQIFPASHQYDYWLGRCPITELSASHYPFYLWTHWNEIWKQ